MFQHTQRNLGKMTWHFFYCAEHDKFQVTISLVNATWQHIECFVVFWSKFLRLQDKQLNVRFKEEVG